MILAFRIFEAEDKCRGDFFIQLTKMRFAPTVYIGFRGASYILILYSHLPHRKISTLNPLSKYIIRALQGSSTWDTSIKIINIFILYKYYR
jgi:hypothetical protein